MADKGWENVCRGRVQLPTCLTSGPTQEAKEASTTLLAPLLLLLPGGRSCGLRCSCRLDWLGAGAQRLLLLLPGANLQAARWSQPQVPCAAENKSCLAFCR